MIISLHTQYNKYELAFCEILHLFYNIEKIYINKPDKNIQSDIIITHSLDIFKDYWQCKFDLLITDYKYSKKNANTTKSEVLRDKEHFNQYIKKGDIPIDEGKQNYSLLYNRLLKRLCKESLYYLLKNETGKIIPWGSLTGVRPTGLLEAEYLNTGDILQARRFMIKEFDIQEDKADLLSDIFTVQQTLKPYTVNDIDLYVSIPFCTTRCSYCSFPGEAIGNRNLVEPYLAALINELHFSARFIKEKNFNLRAIYIGGGTPTSLNAKELKVLLSNIDNLFSNISNIEFTVEAGRPDTIDKEKLTIMRDFNVRRISVNPQTMSNKTLKLIGRQHTAEQTEEAFNLARKAGFKDINMDVIAGLPGEQQSDFLNTMQKISILNPDSITVHSLAIKRTSRLHDQKIKLTQPQIIESMVDVGHKTALSLNMKPYYMYRQKYMAGQQQNVAYAKSGCECLYNVDMMEEKVSVIAIGAGAITKRVFKNKDLRIKRAPNVSNVKIYIERLEDMKQRKIVLFR